MYTSICRNFCIILSHGCLFDWGLLASEVLAWGLLMGANFKGGQLEDLW